MTHDPKFTKAIERLRSQLQREDYSAAMHTFTKTDYLPRKAVQRFVREAPPELTAVFIHNFKLYCETGLTQDNLFDRSLLLSSFLHACAVYSIVRYFREKQGLLKMILDFGIPVPLVLQQAMREIEQGIKQGTPPSKFLSLGFSRVECEPPFYKFTHPELDFVLVAHPNKNAIRKLKERVL